MGLIRLIGLISPISLISLIGPISLISSIGLIRPISPIRLSFSNLYYFSIISEMEAIGEVLLLFFMRKDMMAHVDYPCLR